jgi:glycosyltransferase involved in cell wall biosynthesis
MRILILNWRDVRHPKAGGAEIVTLEHAKAWVKRGHEVTWLAAHFAGAARQEYIDGVNILRRAGSLTIYAFAPLYYLVSRNAFDLVVDQIHGIPFFTPLYAKKRLVFIHEVAGEIWDYMAPFPLNVVGKLFERWYMRLYRKEIIWTDAHSTIPSLVALGIPASSCHAIACPITNMPRSSPMKKEAVPTYIFVSRVVKMKGIEEVIKAFSFIVKETPKAQLWIVGGGDESYIAQLTAMLSDYHIQSRVTFLGKVSEQEKLNRMARAHLLLHASVHEGWGLVVLEAASQWTPSVVYNVSGLCDVVKDKKTGIVLSYNSPREMAREALSLLSDSAQYGRMQKAGYTWVTSLKWNDVTDQSLKLLTSAYTKRSV